MIELVEQIGAWLRDSLSGRAVRPQGRDRRLIEQQRGARRHGFRHGHHRRQNLIIHIDQRQRSERRRLVVGHHRGDAVADIAHLRRQHRLILDPHPIDRLQPAEIVAGHDHANARQMRSARGIDFSDACMGMGTAQNLCVQHAGDRAIEGVDGAAA